MALGESQSLQKIIINLIRLYGRFISPFLGANCRFCPSCSSYACEAIQKHGIVKGLLLSSSRLCRCHPFHTGGYDPVP